MKVERILSLRLHNLLLMWFLLQFLQKQLMLRTLLKDLSDDDDNANGRDNKGEESDH